MSKSKGKREILEMISSGHISSEEGFELIKELMHKAPSIQESDYNRKVSSVMYFEKSWVCSKLDTQNSKWNNKNLLVFVDEKSDTATLEYFRKKQNSKVVLVKEGTEYKAQNESSYIINPLSYSHCQKLFNDLGNKGLLPDGIIYFWPASSTETDIETDIETDRLVRYLDESFKGEGFYSVFNILRALRSLKIPKQFIYAYSRENGVHDFLAGAAAPLSRSLQMFFPGMLFKTVELKTSGESLEERLNKLVEEYNYGTSLQEQEIRYESGIRYIPSIIPYKTEVQDSLPIKEGGVYLITGGMGGLGRIFAEYLAKKYKARIVVTGRSELDDCKKKIMNDLQSFGAEVLYVKADVSRLTDMEECMSIVLNKFGFLNGCIHAAGILTDKKILDKEMDEFVEGLKAKVHGTVVLDHVTRNQNLDFFVMFSSISSILGDFGQCDYSMGNCFQDMYASWRNNRRLQGKRGGFTVSLNWPLWKDGGMHIDRDGENLFLKSSGMEYLEVEEGIDAFEKIAFSGNSNIIIIKGHQSRVYGFLNPKVKDNPETKDILKRYEGEKIDLKMLAHKIEADVKSMASSIIKLKEDKFDVCENLGSFGFDSILLKDLSVKINKTFYINTSPSIFFAFSNVRALSEHLASEYKDVMTDYYNNKAIASVFKSDGKSRIKSFSEEPGVKKEYTSVTYDTKGTGKEEVAIIGISGVFPGSSDLERFWENLENGIDLITEVPKERWDWREFYSENIDELNRVNSKWGGFLKDADKFDAQFFNITPREAELMDPQQRIFLEMSWKAVEDAGYKASDLSGREIGVFSGVQFLDYQEMALKSCSTQSHLGTGNAHGMISNRVSFTLNLRGPSESIDTACSSSLVALNRAVRSILSGECEMAIAGGVSLTFSPYTFLGAGKLGILSSDGKCKTFDKEANGYVKGEGVGVVFLKPLKKAVHDGDNIYAVIKAVAVNHGGRANSLTAPNSEAQAQLILKAYEEAAVGCDSITYIEAHGTGTKLGDPVEVDALKKAFNLLVQKSSKTVKRYNYCGLGSVKTNIGHLEPASGIAGVIKVILAMKNGKLPATLHFRELNPYIELKDSPFYVVDKTQNWERLKDEKGGIIPRRAGVSSFGFGGTNAHIVLEEYIENCPCKKITTMEPRIILLSARNEDRLKEYAGLLHQYVLSLAHGKRLVESGNDPFFDKLKSELAEMVAKAIDVGKDCIEGSEDLMEYGIDLVLLSRIVAEVEDNYNFEVDRAYLNKCKTIDDIAGLLAGVGKKATDNLSTYSLEADTEGLFLDRISYTLQVGREAMAERLAFLASNLNELLRKLDGYLTGKSSQDGIFRGSVRKGSHIPELLIGEEEGREYLDKIMTNKKYTTLAQLWVSGIEIDWTRFYKGKNPVRIPLPTYPFERKSYWFDSFMKTSEDNNISDIVSNQKSQKANQVIEDCRHFLCNEVKEYNGNEVRLTVMDKGIALVTMEDRKNSNMFSKEIIAGLIFAFDQIKKNENIKVVIVHGYDNVFCMGGTQEELIGIADKCIDFTDMPFLYRGLLECELPVIAAMSGHAFGGGFVFGMFADIIVMAEQGLYSANFMKYGFTPGLGATFILKEKLGANLASELMFTSKIIRGDELKSRGTSFIIRNQDEVLNEALEIAGTLCEKPVYALKVLKKELSGRILKELPYFIESEKVMHDKTFFNPEVKERINYYFNKKDRDKTAFIENQNHAGKADVTDTKKITLKMMKFSETGKPEVDKADNEEVNDKPTAAIVKKDSTMISHCLKDVKAKITDLVSKVLHVPANEIDTDAAFKDMGVDSINGVEIIRDINKTFGLNLDAVELYDYSNIERLSASVVERINSSIKSPVIDVKEAKNMDMVKENINITKVLLKPKDIKYKEVKAEPVNLKGHKSVNAEIEAIDVDQGINYGKVCKIILGIVSIIIHVPVIDIDIDASFKDMGIDSINGVEIIRDVNREFKLNLDAVELYDHANIKNLSRYITERLKKNHGDNGALGTGQTGETFKPENERFTAEEKMMLGVLKSLKTDQLEIDKVDELLEDLL